MKKFSFVLLILFTTGLLASCSVRYDMKGLRKLEFVQPQEWQLIKKKDDDTYDYVFRFQNQKEWFELYVRTMYVPDKNAENWLKEAANRARREGRQAGEITTFSSPAFKWYMLQTGDTANLKGKEVPISVRQYAAKEARSARLIQCFLVGRKNTFGKLPAGQINSFIDSIRLKDIKLPPQKDPKYYLNFLCSAEEGIFLLSGKRLYLSGKYDRAINVYDSLLNRSLSPKLKARIYNFLSECYLEKGIPPFLASGDTRYFQKALSYARQSLGLRKKFWPADLNAGIAYANMAEYGQAKKFFKAALENSPKTGPERRLAEFHYETCKEPSRFKEALPGIFSRANEVGGFVYSKKDPIVMISGKPCRTGDVLDGYRILKITPNKVYMKFSSRIYVFTMNDVIPKLKEPKKAPKR